MIDKQAAVAKNASVVRLKHLRTTPTTPLSFNSNNSLLRQQHLPPPPKPFPSARKNLPKGKKLVPAPDGPHFSRPTTDACASSQKLAASAGCNPRRSTSRYIQMGKGRSLLHRQSRRCTPRAWTPGCLAHGTQSVPPEATPCRRPFPSW